MLQVKTHFQDISFHQSTPFLFQIGIFVKVDAVDGNSQRVARFAQKVTAQALIRTEGKIPITMSGSPQR